MSRCCSADARGCGQVCPQRAQALPRHLQRRECTCDGRDAAVQCVPPGCDDATCLCVAGRVLDLFAQHRQHPPEFAVPRRSTARPLFECKSLSSLFSRMTRLIFPFECLSHVLPGRQERCALCADGGQRPVQSLHPSSLSGSTFPPSDPEGCG